MNKDTLLSRSEEYIFNEVDNELILMNMNTGLYISLNESGKSIWNLLNSAKTYNEIIDKLADEYNVTKDDCDKDVSPFVSNLVDRKILVAQ